MPNIPEWPWPEWQDLEPFTRVDNPSIANGAVKYRWQTSGYNCPICQILSNRIYTWDYWRNTVQPGFHAGCNCRLVEVRDQSTLESSRNLWGVDQVLFNPNNARVQEWLQAFWRNLNLMQKNATRYSDAFYQFGNVQEGYRSLDGILTSRWLLNFGIPGFILQHPRVNFFTLMGTVAGNLANLSMPILKPGADLPWEVYR